MDLSWKSILSTPPSLLSFCFGATYDPLPPSTNLLRWNISTENSCQLCHKSICTTAHILGACKVALQQGRFTFRHDSVQHPFLSTLQSFLSSYAVFKTNCDTSIEFVKAGSKSQHYIKKKVHLLHFASYWILQSDHLDNKLVIPSFIAVSQLRPNIVLYSISTKTFILLELTCLCEENMEVRHSKKFEKYHHLSLAMISNGWSVHLFLIEVGARG